VNDTEPFDVRLSEPGRLRKLIFIAPRQALYQSACRALENQFARVEVEMLEHVPSAGAVDEAVELVLLGPGLHGTRSEHVRNCRRHFPRAAIIIIVEGPRYDVAEDAMVQGILQADLPLEVWFAVIQLVLAGGEYLYRTPLRVPNHEPEVEQTSPAPARQSAVNEVGTLGILTAREREILLWISEGYQNKFIATRMALSEHTVKAHVHNLMGKLHVTNRTQAAALLREQMPSRSQAGRLEQRDDAGAE
jgi:DNA-binding NarL/FixJ family response regulator